jgi:hypothetical protein
MVGILYSENGQMQIQFSQNITVFPDVSNVEFTELLSLEIIMGNSDIRNS